MKYLNSRIQLISVQNKTIKIVTDKTITKYRIKEILRVLYGLTNLIIHSKNTSNNKHFTIYIK